MSKCVLACVIYGNNITILTSEKMGNLPFLIEGEAEVRRYYYLDGGPLGTVPELFFEKRALITAIQQLLVTSLQHAPW